MLYNVRVFFSPHAEGVRFEGKTGQEAKDLVDTKYKDQETKLNKALDSEVFHNLSTLMKDHIFDIDDPQDREGMKDQLDLQINGGKNIDTVTKQKYKEALSLLTALDALYADHLLEEQDVIDETKRTTAELLADINDNGVTGTEIKTNRSDRYNALRDKQKEIDQEQKDIISDIEDKVNLPQKDKDLLVSFIDKGVLKGVNFMKGMEQMYIQRTFKNFQDETPEQRKQDMKEAKAWVRKVKNALQEQDLWKDVKYINRAEKKEDRMEKKAQNKTVENKSEVLFTEFELRKMFALTAKMMGKDAFASALSDKLHDMPQAPADMPTWETSEEMNTLLQDPDTANLIRGLVVKALPYLTVSSLEDWLTETPGEKLEAYKEKIEKKYGKKIEQKINAAFESLPSDWSLDPAATQEVSKEKLYHQVVASLAAGYMNTPSATGVGIGAAFNMDHLFIGVGISDKGNPGIAVGYEQNINFGKTTKGSVHVGVANFVIPFARVDFKQDVNAQAILNNLKAKKLVTVGVYGEATIGYVGAGVNVGSDLERGIDKQALNLETVLRTQLKDITENSTIDEIKEKLKQNFPKEADDAIRKEVAEHILSGLKDQYSWQDIASTFAAAWKNEAIKNSKGKVDFSVEAGAGLLLGVPVLKAFVGLKIYRRSTMRTDKFDKDEKEKKMNALTGFKKFDTADTKNMTYAEKLERWLGTNYDVDEKDHIITITKTHPSNTPIYDQFDIFIKDKDLVKVTDKEIQFSDAMDIRAGKVIEAHSSKQKLYLGYDEADTDLPKKPINDQVDGDPAAYDTQYDVETTTEVSKDISLDFAPSLTPAEKTAINALTIDKHVAFAEMTDPSPKNKKREAYNTAFGEFVKTTRGTDFALMKQNMDALLNFLSFKPEEKTSFDDLWKKNPETKRAMISALIQAGSYSAKLSAIMQNKGLPGARNIGELLSNRKGHIEAFKNSSVAIDPHSFDAIYKNAKNLGTLQEPYTETPVPNAVALVGYYRKGLAPTTGFIGAGDVHIASGDKLKEDASKETGVYKEFMKIYEKTSDFVAQKEKIQKAVEKFAPGTVLDDAALKTLIVDGKLTINGVEIEMKGNTFSRILNGPCANEGYMLEFGKLSIKYSKKERQPGDVYVGMTHAENYQSANSFRVGVGGAYGETPRPKPVQPKPDKGDSETTIETGTGTTGDGTTTTEQGDGGNTNTGGDDNGDGGGGR